MPQIIRKVKRAAVLTKRTQCLKKYYRERSYRPLYEKLKSNNNYLAKALSQEKQNNQSLFTQNLDLLSEIQELRLGYNAQDNVITNVLNNTREMFKMLVTMSNYMTNTISICQEYVTSNTTVKLSTASTGRKDSSKRLSTKSPAKGVVKPMVSGHTITKPTINLSRVNMENINNPSRLSDIPEVPASNRSSINEDRSPIAVPMAITSLRYESGSAHRMPERLAVAPPRLNDTHVTNDERRLKRKSRHSKKLSGSFSRSRSNRWSDETPRSSMGHINQLGVPTVKLNDVSKLMQNSHSINIRRLIHKVGVQENNDAHHDTSEKSVVTPNTQVSINLDEEDETCTSASHERDSGVQTVNKVSDKGDLTRHSSLTENARPSQNNVWEEDPLEGPSWLFNNTLAVPSRDNEPEESSNHLRVDSDFNNNTSVDIVEYDDDDDDSSATDNNREELPLNLGNFMEPSVSTNNASTLEKDAVPTSDCESSSNHDAGNSPCAVTPTASLSACERNLDNNVEDNTNFSNFVTLRRGQSEVVEEETEDFTLMLAPNCHPIRNMNFDINELRLPTLDEPAINSNVGESDAEDIAISNITSVPASNLALNQDQDVMSVHDRVTIKISLPPANDHERVSTSTERNKYASKKNKRAGVASLKDRAEHVDSDSMTNSRARKRSRPERNRDPSSAKVVLEKLNESRVRQRTSSDETDSQSTNSCMRSTSNQAESFEDTEDSTNSNYASNRPRRRKAPMNLKEPNMKKKLRRSK
ncbi:dentin sialophosphoprotein-like [Ooceraea biroi]|uniref:dentin sialophosphoprotein-like n=1 Tax=Ooceraea biroi TaxID=2015173 RepID=UPI000F095F72|nr:dentin sialophosphoprotein-like [Ooceraea biroi]XP_026827351.1 dentin sialophosphoprotein-like [Ooceraea biroi]XP_026827352.1 dentin sialophosphoprotein-like [Ooceraea biroi]